MRLIGRPHGTRSIAATCALAGSATACGTEAPLETSPFRPRIVSTTVSANPHNVLSVVIMFTAEHAESARVVYRDERLALDSTPFVGVTEGPDTIQALGLRPEMADTIVMGVDGNYIVSFRRLGQIMKIDATSGAVIWRIGGHKSDVTFPDDPFRGFSAQHSAAILPNGNLLLYDNGNQHEPPETRAVDGQATVFYRLLRIASLYRVATP